jgi:hypothetical protein
MSNLHHNIWPVWVNLSLEALILVASFMLVHYVFKDRKIIEFDQNYLYIENVILNTEEVIPLKNIHWLNMRMGTIETGTTWYFKYSLHYSDIKNVEQKIRFYIKSSCKELTDFVKLVKIKNPDFRDKNWSWTFDLKD